MNDVPMPTCGNATSALLTHVRVLQIGHGLAASVCGRIFADVGAAVSLASPAEPASSPIPASASPVASVLNQDRIPVASGHDALRAAVRKCDVVICEGTPEELSAQGIDPTELQNDNPEVVVVAISPFGLHGPMANAPRSDLTLLAKSGIARQLTGQVQDLSEPPLGAIGMQSAFVGGLAAASAAMQSLVGASRPGLVDVAQTTALATLSIQALCQASLHGKPWSRQRVGDGNGATVTILPAADGYFAISPREEHQWRAWLGVMGDPDWADDPRFAKKSDRAANWDALYALLCAWSQSQRKDSVSQSAQAAHVPSFALCELPEHLDNPQFDHRGFYRTALDAKHRTLRIPSAPFTASHVASQDTASPPPNRPHEPHTGVATTPQASDAPLAGVTVLDFSWVIAGPTATRYLAAMGADVIKVEAPGRGDPGRASELHTVLGQNKRSIALDLKSPEGLAIAGRLAASADVIIENFATGVMERFGLDHAQVAASNPGVVYVSASGLGRTGPNAKAVAYGTLLQCYSGFAALNRFPGQTPRVGMAWLDPMCGLLLPFATAAALSKRAHSGVGTRIDFSMVEAMLWTLQAPLIQAQVGDTPQPHANRSPGVCPQGVFACRGSDEWLALSVLDQTQWHALCALIPELLDKQPWSAPERISAEEDIHAAIDRWLCERDAEWTEALFLAHGIPAGVVARTTELVNDAQFGARRFWENTPDGKLPSLPWVSAYRTAPRAAPKLGADTKAVLRETLGMSPDDIDAAAAGGAFGRVT